MKAVSLEQEVLRLLQVLLTQSEEKSEALSYFLTQWGSSRVSESPWQIGDRPSLKSFVVSITESQMFRNIQPLIKWCQYPH